jgi:ribonuclease Z
MLCRINGNMVLFDCGEGTQVSLRTLGWGFKNIDAICFTHFHADHISGLPGLLLTIANSNRTEPVKLFGPPGIMQVVNSLCIIARDLTFDLEFHEWKSGTLTYVWEDFFIEALPVHHRIQCFTYTVNLPRRGRFDPERAKENEVPLKFWSRLQKQSGEEIVYEGKRFTSNMVLGAPRRGLKLAYCTDTRPTASLPDFVSGSDLLICEGLYGDPADNEKAAAHKHMSFQDAASLAAKANVKELWLTHFSPALPNPFDYKNVAKEIFPNTHIGRDRMSKTVRFAED